MALTQISTAGVKDDIITAAKIADDAVTEALISDESVDEARLKISNAGTNGQFLQKQSGNTGGLTWADASSVGGATGVDFNDDVKIRLGTGNDLEIFHDGSHSYIHATGTGNFQLKGDSVYIRSNDTEEAINCNANGSVELFHDNVKKFETASGGASVTGDLSTSGDIKITGDGSGCKLEIGAGQDFQAYHDSHNYLDSLGTAELRIRVKENESAIIAKPDGSVDLYYDNALRAYTSTNGFQVYKASSDDVEFRIVNTQNTTAGATNTILSQHDLRTTAKIVFGRMNDNSDFSAGAGTTQGDIQFWTTQGGTTAKRGTFINSGGLCFGTDTAAANALDDYEEGTFTPILRTNGSTTGQVTGSGTYVKIGRLVHIHVLFGNKTLTSLPNGDIAVVSLPFTSNHTNGDEFGMSSKCVIMGVDSNSTHGYFRSGNGSANAYGYYNQDGSTWAQWSTTQWDNSGVYLIFNMTYFTNS